MHTQQVDHVEESISTCRFAQRCAQLSTDVLANEALDPDQLVRGWVDGGCVLGGVVMEGGLLWVVGGWRACLGGKEGYKDVILSTRPHPVHKPS